MAWTRSPWMRLIALAIGVALVVAHVEERGSFFADLKGATLADQAPDQVAWRCRCPLRRPPRIRTGAPLPTCPFHALSR